MTDSEQSAGRIVVGVDGSPCSILALQRAGRIAEALKVGIDALSTWQYPSYMGEGFVDEVHPDSDAEQFLSDSITAAFGTDTPSDLRKLVVQGSPSKVLVDVSRQAEMLVVGSRGHGGFVGLLLGSVSAQCADHAHCPVLVVHSRDHH